MTDHHRFQQFIAHQPKRKRAGVVCVACHEKKIKCDLEEIRTRGYSTCTNCAATGYECRSRPSNRDRRRRRLLERSLPPQIVPPRDAVHDRQDLLTTPPLSAERIPSVSDHVQDRSAVTSVEDSFAPTDEDLYQPHGSASCIIEASAAHLSSPQQIEQLQPQNQETMFQIQPNESLTLHARNNAADSYLGKTGFMEVWGPETRHDADGQLQNNRAQSEALELPLPELQQGFEETYFEYCYTWCPVLDREALSTELKQSPLLLNALALSGSHVEPPMIQYAGSATYYDRAKKLLYGDKEEDLIMCLKAIALFYWWSPRAPSRVHRDSSWWWTTAAIRHAQHGGFHREPKPSHTNRSSINPGLRRRIWWTLFARERLTALCQDRPCVIDPEDCDILEPSLDDFPKEQSSRAEIFIYWVRLCAIIGRVAKFLSRPSRTSSSPFPAHLAKELIHWVQSLPSSLTLPIASDRTTSFNRDIHQLHLPYLAVVIVLHLSRSSQTLPKAYPAAILAASCIARILKDCLARGRIRYLMAVSCWYCGIALLALLQARTVEHLATSADEDIRIILIALKELRVMWPTANIFLRGFERLQSHSMSEHASANTRNPTPRPDGAADLDDVSSSHGIDWTSYLPYATVQTSGLASMLLPEHGNDLFMDEAGFGFMTLQMNDLFDPFDSYLDTMPVLTVP